MRVELGRRGVIVFDCVGRAHDLSPFEAGQGAHDLGLQGLRQAHRQAVEIKLEGATPFWLDENLVPLLVGKARNFVLYGGAVARADAFDAPAVHGRVRQVGSDDLVGVGMGVGDPAGHLRLDNFLHRIGKGARGIIPGLFRKRGKVERAAVDAGGRARFESAGLKTERDQAFGGLFIGGLASAARAIGKIADVDLAAEEGAGRQNDGAPSVGNAALDANALDGPFLNQQALHQTLADVEMRLLFAGVLQLKLVILFVGLRPRGAHGWPARGVEAAELNAGAVDIDGHLATERVDFLDDVPLAYSADSRVAG